MTRSIAMQRMSVEHVIPMAERDCPNIVEALKDAALTLAWIERKAELIKEIDRLDREAPALSEIVKGGTRIVGARRYDEDMIYEGVPFAKRQQEFRKKIVDRFDEDGGGE